MKKSTTAKKAMKKGAAKKAMKKSTPAKKAMKKGMKTAGAQTAAKNAMKTGSMAWSFLWLEFLDSLEGRSSGV